MNAWLNRTLRQKTAAIVASIFVSMTFAGCAKDNRMKFSDFLELQDRMDKAQLEIAAERPIPKINVDDYLRRYTLGMGDVFTVTLTGMGEAAPIPPFQCRVDRNGEITAPLVGQVKVEGMELEDAEKAIYKAYVPAVYAQTVAHIDINETDVTRVVVVGAATVPGMVALKRNERTALHAIILAGGVSETASGYVTLRRIREPDQRTVYNLRDPYEMQEALAEAPLQNGDIVEVGAAVPNTIFVGGLVNRMGPQMYPSGSEITILQALAAAGGTRDNVTPPEGTLIRRMPDGSDIHVKLDLKRLRHGTDPNIALAGGDIFWVPDTVGTRIEEFINRNIFLRAGVSVTYNVSGVEYMNRNSQQNGSGGGGDLQNQYDPLGFLQRNTSLQNLINRPAP